MSLSLQGRTTHLFTLLCYKAPCAAAAKIPGADDLWRFSFKPGVAQPWAGAGVSTGDRANLSRTVGARLFLAAIPGMKSLNELVCFVIHHKACPVVPQAAILAKTPPNDTSQKSFSRQFAYTCW